MSKQPLSNRSRSRRGGPSGRQVVGEYVGQPVGDAAEAVRRAGLRPGLDRSFGCEDELIGLVVAQEPVAGDDLARNGMVTLYVAAPGIGPVEEPGASDTEAPVRASVPSVLAEVEPLDAASSPGRRRRRKRGVPGRERVSLLRLGDGNTTSTDTPVEVQGISNAAQIAAGGYHTCAVVATGHIQCWGDNESGQLGDGTATDSSTPVEVTGLP